MRIERTFQNETTAYESDLPQLLLGRSSEGFVPDLDLSPDVFVSRRHARIVFADGGCWLEDLGSKYGTKLNGVEIKGAGRCPLEASNEVQIGETTLRISMSPEELAALSMPVATDETNLRITSQLEVRGISDGSALLALPLELGEETDADRLLALVVQRVVEIIPGARRGALLLCSTNDQLILKAHTGSDDPPVSETLARRAMSERRGYVWQRDPNAAVSASMKRLKIESGIYAPLLYKGRALGVICVDNPKSNAPFGEDSLRLLIGCANYAAVAVANQELQEKLRTNARLLERLLASFSPRIREKLLEKARHGRLRPGGEMSEVTILFSDIRGFTRIASGMDAADTVDLLNDYFSALVAEIFRFDGTVDKFIGDAILAVFGSPVSDAGQHEHAVRAALAMQAAAANVNQVRAARGQVTCEIGIGIHTGTVLHGFIGAAERLEFTVIGDPVNRASRYCNGAKGGEVLISPQVFERVFKMVRAEKVSITTKHEGEFGAHRVSGWNE